MSSEISSGFFFSEDAAGNYSEIPLRDISISRDILMNFFQSSSMEIFGIFHYKFLYFILLKFLPWFFPGFSRRLLQTISSVSPALIPTRVFLFLEVSLFVPSEIFPGIFLEIPAQYVQEFLQKYSRSSSWNWSEILKIQKKTLNNPLVFLVTFWKNLWKIPGEISAHVLQDSCIF